MKIDIPRRVMSLLQPGGTFPYVLALAAVTVATIARVPLQSALGEASPFLFYWPAVAAVAVGLGLKPGLLATVTAAVLTDYYWMPPHKVFSLNEPELLQILTFCFGTASLAGLSEWLRREKTCKEHFRSTLANTPEAIMTVDNSGRIIFLNAAAQLLTGLSQEYAVGQAIGGALFLIDPAARCPVGIRFQEVLLNDEAHRLPPHLTLVSRSGRQHPVRAKVTGMFDSRGQRTGTVIVFQSRAGVPPSPELQMTSPVGSNLLPQYS